MSRKGSPDPHPRDMVGYGASPPDPLWPNGARLAVQFVLNYEEGAERCVLDVTPAGLQVVEILPGWSREQIAESTEAALIW